MFDPEEKAITRARALSNWYSASLRRFLEEHAGESVAQLDNENSRIQKLLDLAPETAVCFVGVSGIGKSTLLNAIVAGERTLAPSGGVGPLTALATEVRYSDKGYLRAQYQPKHRLWRVVWALNSHVERAQKFPTVLATEIEHTVENDVGTAEIAAEAKLASEPENEGSSRTMAEFIRVARLMVAGNQDEERPLEYLADALAIACSVKPRWNSELSSQDASRIEQIRRALALAEQNQTIEQHDSGSREFREVLKVHAAGFLSPLIRRIEVGWPSDALSDGLVLVDLPGVGVAGDVYKGETQSFVREKARAVVLVMDRAGLTDSVMDLLKTTGYWDRLLLSSDDPDADPCSLILAVTHVDDLANQEWRDLDPDESGRRPNKIQVFEQIQARLKDGLGKQLERHLAEFTVTEQSAAVREAREIAARHLLSSFQIHPVSAVQYRQILANNEDDPAFLRLPDQTGVPALSQALHTLARGRRERRVSSLNSLSRRFAEALSSLLSTIEEKWRSGRAAEEAERVRAALQVVLDEKNREYDSRRASFRNFLKETVPVEIKLAVHEAKDEAEKDVYKYLRSLQDAHWATLRAAVTRGGTYHGRRYINLPFDIALKFQEPVASVWSQRLLKTIRHETYQLAGSIRQLVDEICDRAIADHAAYVDQKIVERQKKLVSAQVEQLRDVGKEVVDDLRDVVKNRIVESIQKPIRNACEAFVEQGKHMGPGVKQRILEMFRELADNATTAASVPTRRTLLARYETVEGEIRKAFEEWGHPLEAAMNAIVERHEDRIRRSDNQKRQRVLGQLEQLRSEWPRFEGLLRDPAEVVTQ